MIYSTKEFMNLLVEHMGPSTPSSRKILLSWIEVIDSDRGRSQDLELEGATLLLAMCNGSGFLVYCFTIKDFCLKFFK